MRYLGIPTLLGLLLLSGCGGGTAFTTSEDIDGLALEDATFAIFGVDPDVEDFIDFAWIWVSDDPDACGTIARDFDNDADAYFDAATGGEIAGTFVLLLPIKESEEGANISLESGEELIGNEVDRATTVSFFTSDGAGNVAGGGDFPGDRVGGVLTIDRLIRDEIFSGSISTVIERDFSTDDLLATPFTFEGSFSATHCPAIDDDLAGFIPF